MPADDRLPVVLDAVLDLARTATPGALEAALAEARGLVCDAREARDPAMLRRMQAALTAAVGRLEREQQQVARELGALQRESLRHPVYRSLHRPRPAVDWRA